MAMFHQINAIEDTIGQKTKDTKYYDADKASQAQDNAQEVGEAGKQKTAEAKDKAGEITTNAGKMVEQAEDKLMERWDNTKNAVTGKSQ